MQPFGIVPNASDPRYSNYGQIAQSGGAPAQFMGGSMQSAMPSVRPRVSAPSFRGGGYDDAVFRPGDLAGGKPDNGVLYPNSQAGGHPVMLGSGPAYSSPSPGGYSGAQAPIPGMTPSYQGSHSPNWNASISSSRDQQRASTAAWTNARANGAGYVDATRAASNARNGVIDNGENPAGPTVYIPGGSRGAPSILPPNANVVGPMGAASQSATPGISPKYDPSAAFSRYRGEGHVVQDPQVWDPIAKQFKSGGTHVEYGMSPEDARKGVREDMSGVLAPGQAPATQPSVPTPSFNQPMAPAFPAWMGKNGTSPDPDRTNHAQWSDQAARTAWGNVQQRFGGNTQAAGDAFHEMMGHYGLDGYGILNHWAQGGTIDQTEQLHPATVGTTNIPYSMLGANNGLDPSQNYGVPRQAVPGGSFPSMGKVTPAYTTPFPGNTPLDQSPLGSFPMANMPNATPATNAAMGTAVGDGATPTRQTRQAKNSGATAQPAAQSKASPSESDIAFTAQKYGISPDEVRRRIGG